MPPWELEYSENVELFPIKAKHKDYHKFVHANMNSLFQLNIYRFKFHTMEQCMWVQLLSCVWFWPQALLPMEFSTLEY